MTTVPSHSRPNYFGEACACGCGGRPVAKAQYIRGHRPPPTLADVFWPKVATAPGNGCWEWTAYIRPAGYGQVGVPGTHRTIDAHRASWLVNFGPIPDGLHVCHTCDNRRCVRPDHLWLGTAADNQHDKVAKHRTRRVYGLASSNGRLTPDDVAAIRAEYRFGTVYPAPSSSRALAERFGVTPQYICQLVMRTWRRAG